MKILFAGGGTGGHINPALAVAGYIREREPETQILYVGAKGGMEEKLVPKAGFPFRSITISGFQRKLTLKNVGRNLRTAVRVFTSSAEARKILREFAPDICMGTGGYVSGPVIREAAKLGIPTVIHESNAYPGVTTKMLAKKVDRVMLAVADAESYFPGVSCELTGNPVRPAVIRARREEARRALSLDERPMILSFGGSLGARAINEAVADLLVRSGKDGRFQHIHGYGQYGTWMPGLLEEKGLSLQDAGNIDLREYIDNMAECLAAADLVICRAGAITLSELQAQGKGAILIPSPNVAENHQYHNAMALVKRGAAALIEEKDLNGEILCQKVDEIFAQPGGAAALGAHAAEMAITDANERIYQTIRSVLREKRA
ncbi:undecaprenyldiphospho-muramoylpentapeptide beta-N-acetylglucosaminyltransferase [Yeguia hominis]|uniref:UDP-N-acetylglucosamine--N-acetylmuramyl-(pentapeptide) pyrophosphoryl-undecaprenol N-acetylglucosamine transferase n=1 Tax=Yeguia hominis TaxID=2763662 RepID=A0A926D7W5_9FIRM|nr:undecaprenyldiphospho-muramoylpentapeptide beta-N-acetylglucosaminyltransferase [Yeguia hominis]MBC8532962.1 undecaprenyldiphospho-muramoylpentapeptide beta-N-acetylglucosaminyltransferase [Yeguia hominis]